MRMKKINGFLCMFLIAAISFICSPSIITAETVANADEGAKTPSGVKSVDEKIVIPPQYNCDPKMLIPGDPKIDPKFLIENFKSRQRD